MFGPDEREEKLVEFRKRIVTLGEELEGLAASSLMQEEAFLVRFLRGSNWDVEIATNLVASSHQMIQDYYPYMSAGPPSKLEHVWRRELILCPELRDEEGRRVVVLRLGLWPPQEVKPLNRCKICFIPRCRSMTSSRQSSPCLSWWYRKRGVR